MKICIILIFMVLLPIFVKADVQTQTSDSSAQAGSWLREHKNWAEGAYGKMRTAGENASDKFSRYDAKYTRLEIRADYSSKTITGRMLGRYESLMDGLDTIRLDMGVNLDINSVSGDVESYHREDDFIYLKLNKTFQKNEIFTVDLTYEGAGYHLMWVGLVFDRMPDGSDFFWTFAEPYGARYWWPCHDVPSDKIDSMDIFVTIPAGQIAGSNGALQSTTDNNDGTQTFHWRESYPIATYLVSVVAGNYFHFQDYYRISESDSMLLDYYVYPENASLAKTIFPEMQDYLDALSHYFGPYPFLREKYGQAQYNMRGAMEHQTLTGIRTVDPSWRYVYVHELGHQWFGDQVTCASWTDIWLNEGFASYSEALYAEWAGYNGQPPGEASLHAYMATQLYQEGGTIIISDTTSSSAIFGRIVYDKAAWVLHMLRHIMGDDPFFGALRDYLNDPRWTYGSVRTENFQEICEKHSALNLDQFFTQWLNYEYYPSYRYYWSLKEQQVSANTVEVVVEQTQQTTLYVMPVDLTFSFSDGTDTTITVSNDRSLQQYIFTLRDRPVKLGFDKNNWILKSAAEIPATAAAGQITIRNIMPNPLNETALIHVTNGLNVPMELQIFDLLGREVRRLKPADVDQFEYYYNWDGRNSQGIRVSAGIYFLRTLAQNGMALHTSGQRKIIVLR